MRLPRGATLIVASHNQGKVREIKALLGPHGIHPVSAGDLGLPEPEETGLTFAANAELKARAAADAGGHAALADDSGLSVAALDGAPGIYSARWAGPTKDFRIAMTRIHDELKQKGATDFAAHFTCALSLAMPPHGNNKGEMQTFVGEVHGRLVFPPRGTQGFGYDPIFVPEGYDETFGEMAPHAKHAMSHRAKAFEKLLHSHIFDESL
jgi:XTP/dITP diphosphohydrolase